MYSEVKKLNNGFFIVGSLSIAMGLFFIFSGNIGGRTTTSIRVGGSSWTFKATLGAGLIFNGLFISLLGFIM